LSNQNQNHGFLIVGQRSADFLDIINIPVRAISGAISFITGTYSDYGDPQRVELINEAERHTIWVPLVTELSTEGANRSPENKTRPSFDDFFQDSRISLTI
jgi:hypothetical protein